VVPSKYTSFPLFPQFAPQLHTNCTRNSIYQLDWRLETLKGPFFVDTSRILRQTPSASVYNDIYIQCREKKGLFERLTSNCEYGVSILYLGENHVHPLYGIDDNISIKSIISILSTLFAPKLHQNCTKINWSGGLIQTNPLLYDSMPRQVNNLDIYSSTNNRKSTHCSRKLKARS